MEPAPTGPWNKCNCINAIRRGRVRPAASRAASSDATSTKLRERRSSCGARSMCAAGAFAGRDDRRRLFRSERLHPSPPNAPRVANPPGTPAGHGLFRTPLSHRGLRGRRLGHAVHGVCGLAEHVRRAGSPLTGVRGVNASAGNGSGKVLRMAWTSTSATTANTRGSLTYHTSWPPLIPCKGRQTPCCLGWRSSTHRPLRESMAGQQCSKRPPVLATPARRRWTCGARLLLEPPPTKRRPQRQTPGCPWRTTRLGRL